MHKNIRIYYLASFLGALAFYTPVWNFFFTLHLHFSTGWAVLITTLVGFSSFLFEIPTGSWADRFGRKRLYIIWQIMGISGMSFYFWADNVFMFLLSAIIIGFGYAIQSGNIEALIHDHLEERWEEEKYKSIQSSGYSFFFFGRAIACVAWGFLFTIDPILPYAATIACSIIVLPLLFLLNEPKQALSPEHTDVLHIKKTILSIKNRSDMLYIISALTIVSSIGNMYWFTYQPYLDIIGFRVTSIGAIFGFIALVSAGGSLLLKKLQHSNISELKILQYLIIALVIESIGFYACVFYGSPLGIVPMIFNAVIGGFTMSLGNGYILSRVSKSHKSTSLSVFSFCITLGYFLFSAGMGFFIDRFSIETAYLWISLSVLILLPVNRLILRIVQKTPENRALSNT